jgi:2-hydroxycyclohexanecarboxyl-CoA dehydrogenase
VIADKGRFASHIWEFMGLQGRIAVVTGGASGIGAAIARQLSRDGAAVAILDLDKDGAAEVAREIEKSGGRALGVRANVAVPGSVSTAIDQVETELGPVGILVNNAGFGGIVPLASMTTSQWDRMIAVHLSGTFHCTRAVVNGMIERRAGRIVNISSVGGLVGAPGNVHYSAAKAGILGFTKALAAELGPSGVTVNAIAPGLIETPILRAAGLDEQAIQNLKGMVPLGRIGQPEDIASACAYIASDAASFLTGQVISPNGGAWR